MNHSVDQLQRILIPFLGGASTVVLLLLAMLVVGKGMAKLGSSRRARLEKQCQPLVDALLLPNPSIRTAEQLACYVPKHGEVVGQLLVAPDSRVAGPAIDRLRHTARAFGTIEEWIRTLSDRRWWRRADAARSLGQLKVASAVDLLVAALDDHDEEVRAAAVDALGNIGEPRTVPALVSRLPRQSRHQRVRIVEALRRLNQTLERRVAQSTAETALANSATTESPAEPKMRPWCSAMTEPMIWKHACRSASVPASSSPIKREN